MRRISRVILDEPTLFISWLLLVSASLGALGVWIFRAQIATDFGVLWRTANESMSIVYTPHARYPFPYPPSAKLLLSPLAILPKWPAFALWTALSAAALWAAVRPYLCHWPSIMMMASPPVTGGLATGQTTMLLAAAILWGLRSERRILAGLVFGVAASIKPQLVLFLPILLLMKRDRKAIAASIVSFSGVLAMTTLIYGLDVWADWLGALPNFRQALYDLKIIGAVITLPGFADQLGLPILPFVGAGAALGAVLVIRGAKTDFIDQAALISIASFFVSPYAMGYDLILATPFLVREIFRRNFLGTIVLAGAPNPLPLFLGAAALLGARLDVADLTNRFREKSVESS